MVKKDGNLRMANKAGRKKKKKGTRRRGMSGALRMENAAAAERVGPVRDNGYLFIRHNI